MSKELTGNRKGNTMAKCGKPKKMMMGGPTATTMQRAVPTPAIMPAAPAARPIMSRYADAMGAARGKAPVAVTPAMQRPVAAMKKGGKIDGVAMRGKTKGRMC